MKLYFIRHGETDYNKQWLIQGLSDIPLNEKGMGQAQRAAEWFKIRGIEFDRVFASPLIRAHKTASIVSGWKMADIVTDARVRELSFGVYEGSCFKTLPEEVMHLFKRPDLYEAPEGAESVIALCTRCGEFLESMQQLAAEEPEVKNVLVATHGAALRGLLSCIEKTSMAEFWREGITNCCIVAVDVDVNGCRLEGIIDPLAESVAKA